MDGREIVKRYEMLKSIRKSNIEQTWDQIEQFISPIRSGKFYQEQSTELEIQQRRPEVWDLTAPWALEVLASSMQSSLVSPAIKWFELGFRNQILQKDKESRFWIETCSENMFDTIQESNFNVEIASAFLDLGAFGNTLIVAESVEEKEWHGLDFSCVPIREIYFEEDHKGHAMSVFRRLQWTPSQILEKWGEEFYQTIPETIRIKAESAQGVDNKLDIVFAIYRRKEIPLKYTGVKAPQNRPWGSKYILVSAAIELGDEGGYYEMPAFVTRWQKTSGSMWGHGPGAIAIPTVKYLNAWMQTEKAAAEKVVDPATIATERGLLSDLDLTPGGLTVVRSIDDLKPFSSTANFVVSQNTITELRAMIRMVFRTDDLQLKESPAMTATEVSARIELMQRIFGSVVTRIQSDLLDPLLTRVFAIMFRMQRFPPTPLKVLEMGGEYDIKYLGPLMRAQRIDAVSAIERTLSVAAGMAQVFPDAAAAIDSVKAIRDIAEKLGASADILRSDAEIKKMKAEQQAAQQLQLAQMQGQALESHAKAAKTISEAAPQNGTPQ